MRVCPECDRQGREEICPACGTRTLLDAPSDAAIDPLLGRVFEGRYRLESLLGRGGMGAVYKATQITMNKVVAVKVVKPELAANAEAAKRFHREAKAASSLSHPHTIRVFDFGQTPQRELYMVMELLDGPSLGKLLHGGEPLPLQRTLKIVAEVASSLVEAHERGLVHRDLKPENVILLNLANDPDFVKVLDFGIAKFLTGSSGDSNVTRTGAVIGTPQYMAPEQARASRSLSTAADVYSLGVMLYEMLTGELPFAGDSPIDMLMAHVHDPVPDLPADLDVPDGVRRLVSRMLAKQPDERPRAAEVARDLEEAREREKAMAFLARTGAPVGTSLPGPLSIAGEGGVAESLEFDLPRGRGPKALFLAGGVLLAIAGAVLALWLFQSTPPEPIVDVPKAMPTAVPPARPPAEPVHVPSPPVEVAPTPPVYVPPATPATPPAETKPEPSTPAPGVPAVVSPKPASVAPKPAVARPKTPKAKPPAPKPAPAAPAEEPDGRTPAVW